MSPRRLQPLTKEQIEYILDNKDKKSLRAIGKELGCSHEWVNLIIRKNGQRKHRVLKPSIVSRDCAGGCGKVITNDKFNKYCPLCRHKIYAMRFHKINMKRIEEKRARIARVLG